MSPVFILVIFVIISKVDTSIVVVLFNPTVYALNPSQSLYFVRLSVPYSYLLYNRGGS